MGEHRIAAAGDPFSSVVMHEESSLERLLYACDDCGRAFPRQKLIELHPDRHDDMRFFNGWRLCRSCARRGNVKY